MFSSLKILATKYPMRKIEIDRISAGPIGAIPYKLFNGNYI